MRHKPTTAEDRLWHVLRRDALEGFKFRRQHAIGPFIVDFYCSKERLVIEIDGPVHETTQEHDQARQEFLEARGLKVLRFTNDEVLSNLKCVTDLIIGTLQK